MQLKVVFNILEIDVMREEMEGGRGRDKFKLPQGVFTLHNIFSAKSSMARG